MQEHIKLTKATSSNNEVQKESNTDRIFKDAPVDEPFKKMTVWFSKMRGRRVAWSILHAWGA